MLVRGKPNLRLSWKSLLSDFSRIKLCLKGFLLVPKGWVTVQRVSAARVPRGALGNLRSCLILLPKAGFLASYHATTSLMSFFNDSIRST